jgi:hypothetical protein
MFNWLIFAFALWASPTDAQGVYPGGGGGYNTFCFTQSPGTNNNTCASTAFVTAALAAYTPAVSLSANSVYGNATSGAANGTSLSVPSCSTSASAIAYTTNTGFSCNSAIDAATLGSATFAAPAAIGSGTPAAGTFTTLTATNITTLAAGTTSIAPLKFQSGTNLTTATAGVIEYDGTVYYNTNNASNRGLLQSEQFVVLTSNRTFTNNSSLQAIFAGGGGPTNGRITLPTGTYFFEMSVYVSSLSASSHYLSVAFAGTATIGNFKALVLDQLGGATPMTSAATTQIHSANTTQTDMFQVTGSFTVTVTGTFIPQMSQTTNTAACVINPSSYFKLHQAGSSSVATVGNWD